MLHFRYRFEKAARFFHVLLGTRSFANDNQSVALLEAKSSDWKNKAVGEWHQASVRLSELSTPQGDSCPPNAGVFFILFDSQLKDLGLTIDDVRVTRGF